MYVSSVVLRHKNNHGNPMFTDISIWTSVVVWLYFLQRTITYLYEMWNLRDVKCFHGNNYSFMIPETCYNAGDSRKKRLGPPLEQFESVGPQWWKQLSSYQVSIRQHVRCSHPPVEVAPLFWRADLCRGLQLDIAGGRSRSTGIFIPTVHLSREQKSVICKPSLHHSAKGLISVDDPARVR